MIAGALGHLALLALPLAAAGPSRAAQPGVLLFVALALSFGVLESRVQVQERVDREPLAVLGGLSLYAVFAVGLAAGHATGPAAAAAGTALMVTGIALRLAAIRRLGPWFCSTSQAFPDQPRVTVGIYAWLAHPSEIGVVAVGLGSALLLGSAAAAAIALAVALPASLARVRREARVR